MDLSELRQREALARSKWYSASVELGKAKGREAAAYSLWTALVEQIENLEDK